jgi:hypothetical protein
LLPHRKIDMVAVVQIADGKHAQATDGVISDWYDSDLSKTVRAEFQRAVKDLRMLPAVRWGRPDYDYLRDGIGEIRFKKEGKQWRPLGFFAPPSLASEILKSLAIEEESEVFVLVLGAYKKQGSKRGRDHDNWTPRNAIDTAVKRRIDVIEQRRKVTFHVLRF